VAIRVYPLSTAALASDRLKRKSGLGLRLGAASYAVMHRCDMMPVSDTLALTWRCWWRQVIAILPPAFAPARRRVVVGRNIPMDGSTFDAWSRAVAQNRSRRGLTRLLAGLALSGPLALVGRLEVAAKHKKRKRRRARRRR
jgi:hypothetical protein